MSETNRGKIFVSYRREGGQELARLILDHLNFRGYDVFLDTESLGGGTFNTKLLQRIRESSDFVLILTPGALDRCVNKSDWVRKELACALKNGVNVVPVFAKGFTFESAGPLPEDIKDVADYNGPTVNYEYFNAFIDKLEDFLTAKCMEDPYAAPEKKKKQTSPAKKQRFKSRILGGIAALLLLSIILVPILLNRGDGLPPLSEKQTFGSSTGNLCNDGLGSASGADSSGSKTNTFIHSLDKRLYWYNTSKRSIMTSFEEEDAFAILSDVTVGFFSVSTDWFYYTIKDADTTLYRARRLENGTVMGEAEKLASGISGENDIIVEEEYAYYWRSGRGLCKLHLAKNGKESLLTPMETIWQAQLFGKSADWIYGCNEDSIWRINAISGQQESVLLAKDHFTDRTITGGNAYGDWVYFITSDRGEDAFSHADRLYRIHIDGSGMEQLFVAEDSAHKLISVCVYDETKLMLIAEQDGERLFYRYNTQSGAVTERKTVVGHASVSVPGVTAGNLPTNLCNDGLLLENDEGTATYLTSSNSLFYNRIAGGKVIYYYNSGAHTIRCQWKENDTSDGRDLMSNVTCHYLYVTPDRLYCLLEENGNNTLYYAENDIYNHTIGELHVLAENVVAENSVIVSNGQIYYWVLDKGLYRLPIATKTPVLVYELDEGRTCPSWHSFNITDSELHFYAGNGLYRVVIDEGKLHYLLDGEPYYPDGRIISAASNASTAYYAVKYLDENGYRIKPDEIWQVDLADKNASCLYTMPSTETNITTINLTSRYGYARVEQNGSIELHRFSFSGDEMTLIKTY